MMTRILIADDHALLRRGLKEILMRELEDASCGEAENAQQVLTQIQNQEWDVLILDVTMPGRSGLDVLRDLKTLRPKLPVLVLSMHPEDQYGKRILKAGAAGYMNKDTAPEELIKAIRKVRTGGRYVSSALAEKLALDLSADTERPIHEMLSEREFEVLRMIASGKTVGQIAEELHLSITTISTYRARVLEKMSMATAAELMHYALQNHLVE
ncbi:MAG TPA: response regulator transcription factor [Bryobacteraceae bacterium]|nr:response regulator transcription factor [Bryobacteraceae bacterium]